MVKIFFFIKRWRLQYSTNICTVGLETPFTYIREKMKSKDLQTAVKNKHENGDGPTKIFRDLGGVVSLTTIKSWIQMLNKTGSISLSYSSGRPRTVRTKANISKVKYRLDQKKRVSTRRLAVELDISRTSAQRILREDLGCFPYKKIKQPKLTDLQKRKRVKFANWVFNNYTKEDTKKWLFTDEKYFDLDGIYNAQNDRIWAVSREEADKRGGIHQKTKFPVKVMVWLGVCAKGLTVPVILEEGTMDAERYISDVLPIALKSGNKMLGNNWTYQQDGARPHTHNLSQKWCADHFPDFISKDRWPPNSPDLCPLDYSLWNELAESMDWKNITTKGTLIEGIKRSVKKIEKEKILYSVLDFTVRLRLIQKNGGNYIR
jgi:inhibitor of nuclear factor kappa-B kinase subunit alpha